MARMKMDWKIVALAVVFIAIFAFLSNFGDDIGLDPDVGPDLIMVFPGIFVTVLGFVVAVKLGGIFVLPGFGSIGIGLAVLLEELHTGGFVTPNIMAGMTVGQLQVWLIVVGLLIGGILAALGLKGG